MAGEGATLKKTGEHPSRSLGFLSRYHDGELTREEAADFDRHAEQCAECRSAAAEYEAVLAMYRSAAPDLPDDRLAARIRRRIDTELRPRAPVRFVTLQIDLVWASVLAVALVGAIALYALLSRRPPSPVTIAENASPTAIAPPESPKAPETAATAPSPARPQRRDRTARTPALSDRPDAAPPDSPFAPEPESAPAAGAAAIGPPPTAAAAEAKAAGAAADTASADSFREALPVGGPVSPPILLRRVEPRIPDETRQRIAGRAPVVIVAVISEGGEVTRPRIVQSNPALDGAVLAAVRQWRYRPALKDGKPVAAYLTITVNADLR